MPLAADEKFRTRQIVEVIGNETALAISLGSPSPWGKTAYLQPPSGRSASEIGRSEFLP
jgi:hypothetical protein